MVFVGNILHTVPTCSSTPIAAIANAVWHATGVRYRTPPLTPDRVLQHGDLVSQHQEFGVLRG
jgi:hypothetical protein